MNRWWDLVSRGQPLADELVIDAHAHMGPWQAFAIPADPSAAGMVRRMDLVGVRCCIAAPHYGIGPDMVAANRIAEDAARSFPGRILPYCCVSPNVPAEAIIAELGRMLLPRDRPIAVGIKIHPSMHAYPAVGERYRPMWEFAQEHAIPVLAHTWAGDPHCRPSAFLDVARRYPSVPIILGHSGGSWAGVDEALEAALARDTLVLDITASLLKQGLLERMVRTVGSERILFGTDLPFIDCRAQIGYVASARINDEEKRRIFGLNAAWVFGMAVA